MKNFLIVFFVLVTFFLFFGCTGQAVCGDGICSPGEEITCPQDCRVPIEGNVTSSIDDLYVPR